LQLQSLLYSRRLRRRRKQFFVYRRFRNQPHRHTQCMIIIREAIREEKRMRRREMLAALGGATASLATPLYAGNTRTSAGRWPFEETSQLGDWTAINAAGLPAGVPGCVYDGARLESGVPLGGLGTGYLRLDGNGRIGVCSIFNDLVPPRKVSADWLMVQAGTRKVPLSAARIA